MSFIIEVLLGDNYILSCNTTASVAGLVLLLYQFFDEESEVEDYIANKCQR